MEYLILVAAIAAFVGVMAVGAIFAEDSLLMAICYWLVVGSLGIVGLVALYQELWTEHPAYTLDHREWVCTASHREPTTTYVQSGNVMLPITTHSKVCDQYGRRP